MTAYKPLTDEELTLPETVVLSGQRFGKTISRTLIDQCRLANRLAESVERFVNGRLPEDPLSVAEDRMIQALRSYLGETDR